MYLNKFITYNISIAFILFFSTSCRKNISNLEEIPSIDTIVVYPSLALNSVVNYSDWVERIEYIPIPTDTTFLVGKIDKILPTKKYIFIMDEKISRSVFCMDRNGNKVFSITKSGNGPGEYISMSDIAFDEVNEELIIHCYIRKKLLYYDMQGNYIREKLVPYMASRVQPIKDNFALYCWYNNNQELRYHKEYANIALIDSNRKNIISTANYFESPVNKAVVWTSECYFSQINDTLLSFKPDHCNTVYHVTPATIYPAYTLDFGNHKIDSRYWIKTKERGMTLEKINEYSDNLRLCESFYFLEGTNYIYFIYRQKRTLYSVLYSKKTNTLRNFVQTSFINNMDYLTKFRPIAIYNEQFYCLLDSEDVYSIKEYSIPTTIPKKLINSVQEFGNPIIVVFTLKSF